MHFFNYAIACVFVNGRGNLADATDPLLAGNRLPQRCINDKGLLVDEKNPQRLNLQLSGISRLNTNLDIQLDDTY